MKIVCFAHEKKIAQMKIPDFDPHIAPDIVLILNDIGFEFIFGISWVIQFLYSICAAFWSGVYILFGFFYEIGFASSAQCIFVGMAVIVACALVPVILHQVFRDFMSIYDAFGLWVRETQLYYDV